MLASEIVYFRMNLESLDDQNIFSNEYSSHPDREKQVSLQRTWLSSKLV